MSEKWLCPGCKAVNKKPDYILRLAGLSRSLGGVSLGTTGKSPPRCSQCGFEADVNAMLRGEYDHENPEIKDKAPQSEELEPVPRTVHPSGKQDRTALIAVGIVLLLLCVVLIPAGIQYLDRENGNGILPERAAPRITATALPSVRMLGSAQARSLFEAGGVPYLTKVALEEYTPEELFSVGITLTYTINLDKSEPLASDVLWCATTQEILDQNLENIAYTFRLNGESIHPDLFVKEESHSGNVQVYCRQFYTVLTDWSPGTHFIQTIIKYEQPINDGWGDLPTGTKTIEYHVTVLH